MAVTIRSLTLYPVKSCGALPVSRFRCAAAGPEWDREWMVVDENGRFVTQRELPRMALVSPRLTDDALVLSTGSGTLEVPLHAAGATREVEVWGQSTRATDEGDRAATWLSDFLGKPLRLVRISPENRFKDSREQPRTVRFVDSFPLHVCSLDSLADLNRRLPSPVGMERFRANVVVDGLAPWAEDSWKSLRVGGQVFRVGGKCERCTITTVDPGSGTRGVEPLKTLAGFRKGPGNKIEFGQYLHVVEGAELAVGMEVTPE